MPCDFGISAKDQGADVQLSTLLCFTAAASHWPVGKVAAAGVSLSIFFFFFCFAPASFCSLYPPSGPDISVMDTLIAAD